MANTSIKSLEKLREDHQQLKDTAKHNKGVYLKIDGPRQQAKEDILQRVRKRHEQTVTNLKKKHQDKIENLKQELQRIQKEIQTEENEHRAKLQAIDDANRAKLKEQHDKIDRELKPSMFFLIYYILYVERE